MTAGESMTQAEAEAVALPILRYPPSPKQEAFYRSTHKRRLFRAGNQVGKTVACANEGWCRALGTHPYKDVPSGPTRGLVIAADYQSYIDVVGQALFDSCPTWALIDSDFDKNRGWKNHRILLFNGSEILFRWAGSKSTAVAGLTVDWLWIDEPPPRHLFSEAMTRLAVRGGSAFFSMTPIGRPVDWLRLHVEGDADKGVEPEEEWAQFVVRLTTEDCPHRTQESIDVQLAGYLPSEMPQRRDGAWEGAVTDRELETFDDDCVVDCSLADFANGERLSVGLTMDHGEKVARQTALLGVWTSDALLIVDENANTRATTPGDDAAEILTMLERYGMTATDVDLAVGDINSAGKMARGRTVNEELGDALGIDVDKAHKARVRDHIYAVNQMLMGRRLLVHRRCVGLRKSMLNWKHEGKYEDLKHFIDALFYLAPRVDRDFLKHGANPSRLVLK